jgi:hypothetical protein
LTKSKIAEFISRKINDAGVLEKRNGKQVQSKIEHLEKQFKIASDFAQGQTGAGLVETDKAGFDDAIRDRCPLYFDLLPIMGDRAMSRPKVTNLDNLDSSSDSSADNDKKPSANEHGRRQKLPAIIAIENAQQHNNKDKTSPKAITALPKLDDSLSLSPRRTKTARGIELNHPQHMISVAETKASLNKTRERKLRKEIEQQDFATAESKIALEKKELELHLYKVAEIVQIMSTHPTWSADKIKKIYPALADLVDSIYSD